MTKEEFNKRYPNGENLNVHLFKKCLYKIMMGDEIDRIINYARGREKRFLKAFKKMYREMVKDWDTFPFVVALEAVESIELFKDIITYMVFDCEEKYYGSDEK